MRSPLRVPEQYIKPETEPSENKWCNFIHDYCKEKKKTTTKKKKS
jgi:hypothetical protein